MISPTDTHYLVGLFSKLTHPDNVEVELGSMVYDKAADSQRDVDVTIRVTTSYNKRIVYKAVEVKSLRRKVGSEIVEQIAQKLADMPSIDEKAIVSASGFTKPAIKKARAHHVDLLELKEWSSDNDLSTFGHIIVPGVFVSYQWLEPVNVRLNPEVKFNNREKKLIRSNPLVFFPDKPLEEPMPLLAWLARFKSITAADIQTKIPEPSLGITSITQVTISCKIDGEAFIQHGETKIWIKNLCFSGGFEKNSVAMPSSFKALYRLGSSAPLAGCCISKMPDESLMSLAITTDKRIQLSVIPLSERNVGRLHRKRFECLGDDL